MQEAAVELPDAAIVSRPPSAVLPTLNPARATGS